METQHDWLKREIAQGFMLLSALNLKGRPAAKDLKAVAEIWYGLLGKQEWQPERDIPRFQTAFETIAATQTEWPNPADFIRHLPPLPITLVPRLEKKHVRSEFVAAGLKELRKRLAEAPCLNREWIHGQPHRTVDECKRIYAMKQRKKETGND